MFFQNSISTCDIYLPAGNTGTSPRSMSSRFDLRLNMVMSVRYGWQLAHCPMVFYISGILLAASPQEVGTLNRLHRPHGTQ